MSNDTITKRTFLNTTSQEWIALVFGLLLGSVCTWLGTYSYFKEYPLTPHRVMAIKLLSESKAQCEARAFSLKQLQMLDKCKPEDAKRVQLKYASAKAASDNLISMLSIVVIAGVSDKEQSLIDEFNKLQEASNTLSKNTMTW